MPLYFAYGSNMESEQLKRRCPEAAYVAHATLEAHRLIYRGPSKNRGLGVLSIDPAPGHHVPGLVFSMEEETLQTLDRYEGAPEWYLRIEVTPILAGGEQIVAQTYRLPDHVQIMAPTVAYREQVERAYRKLGFELEILTEACRVSSP